MLQTTTYKETPDFFGVDYTKKGIATKVRINYTTFGSPMPGRMFTSSASKYRYSFNGKEEDDETVSTGGGTQDYGLRIYNPALGRFLSVDPLTRKYAYFTPYQFAGNTPIQATDLDGAEPNFDAKLSLKFNLGTLLKKLFFKSIVEVSLEASKTVHDGLVVGQVFEFNSQEKTTTVASTFKADIVSSEYDNNDVASFELKTGVTKVINKGPFGFTNEGSGTRGGTVDTDNDGNQIPVPIEGDFADIPKQENKSEEGGNWSVEEAKNFMSSVKTNSQNSNTSNQKQQKQNEDRKTKESVKVLLKVVETAIDKPQ